MVKYGQIFNEMIFLYYNKCGFSLNISHKVFLGLLIHEIYQETLPSFSHQLNIYLFTSK